MAYGLDRWKQFASAGGMTGRSTHSQETITDLEGFHQALKIAVTTTETPASNECYSLVQRLEAQDSIRFGVNLKCTADDIVFLMLKQMPQ